MAALDKWRQLELTAESRSRLDTLLTAERETALDADARESLLDAFMETLSDVQLTTFARMVRELTHPVH